MITNVTDDIRFDWQALRRTSQAAPFPWLAKLVTLVSVTPDGVVTQAKSDAEKCAMLAEAGDQDLVLAAWPGEWSQDVFVVDDLKGARVSVGLPRHRATSATDSAPHSDTPAQHDYISPMGLWRRLAESPSLSLEGQRRIAMTRSSRDVALALLARPDLDEETRQQVLRADGYSVPEALVASGRLTSDEIAALIDRHPDSGDLYQAALSNPEGTTAAKRKIASLSSAEAAHVWMYSHIWSKKRPELAAELLPVVLTAPADSPSNEIPGDVRYERPAVIRSLAFSMLPERRLELLRSPVCGQPLQRALLEGNARDPLSDEELVACIPEVTRPQEYLSAGSIPQVIQYIQRFPRLADLAQPQLEQAVVDLIVDGWSPVQHAQSGQWNVLMNLAGIAETTGLLDKLAQASVYDRAAMVSLPGPLHQQRWHDSRRYDLVDTLLNKAQIPDTAAVHILDRLTEAEIDDVVASAGNRSRLHLLCQEALQRRPSRTLASFRTGARRLPEKLPSDEDLSGIDDPQAVLLDLIKSRGMDQDRKIQHALNSSYMTDDLAWRLPVKSLEEHPVYGPRLAAQIAEICGNSPARWQEFASSWNQPTQLLASSLFKRLRKVVATD
jgi:hypothetical protein